MLQTVSNTSLIIVLYCHAFSFLVTLANSHNMSVASKSGEISEVMYGRMCQQASHLGSEQTDSGSQQELLSSQDSGFPLTLSIFETLHVQITRKQKKIGRILRMAFPYLAPVTKYTAQNILLRA